MTSFAGEKPGTYAETTSIKQNMTSGGNLAFHNFNNDFAHISNANERRRLALAEIDKAPFGRYHVWAIAVAGIGFFTDSCDIFAIGLVTSLLGIVYFGGKILDANDTVIKVATSAGTVSGQVGFGILADVVGRKKMYGLELMIIIFSTLAQSLSSSSPAMSIVGLMLLLTVSQFFSAGPNSATFIIPGEVFPTRHRSTSHGISAASGKLGAIMGHGTGCVWVSEEHLGGCRQGQE